MPRVMGDDARSSRAFALARGHIIGQSPGALGDRPFVEDIGADRVHLAAAAAGPEFEHGVKSIVELGPPSCSMSSSSRARYLVNGASVSQRRILAAAGPKFVPRIRRARAV